MLDEKALLAAMAYVDLNPVRAGLAETPETSDYTSIQERVVGLPKEAASQASPQETATVKDPEVMLVMLDGEQLQPEAETQVLPQAPLTPFDATAQTLWAVPFAFDDYLELVDWTGRALRADKPGYIKAQEPKILARLVWMGSGLSAIRNVSSRNSGRQSAHRHRSRISGRGVRPDICVVSGLRERCLSPNRRRDRVKDGVLTLLFLVYRVP